MLRRLLNRLFHKKPEPDDIAEEKWNSGFSLLKKKRFIEESAEDFEARHTGTNFRLSLKKKNLFAWALYSPYRYRNMVVEMDISFDSANGYSAAGVMFRYVNGENYYYALISKRGMFRFDVVFNGNPSALIPWMEVPLPEDADTFKLRLIAHYDTFAFYLNDEWIAELKDESFENGYVAFCAQNYDEKDEGEFELSHMSLESRPVEVEYWYYRWTRVIPADPKRRIALAERLNGQGHFTAALIQLRRAYQDRRPDAEGAFLMAEIYLNLQLFDEALHYLEKTLELKPDWVEARFDKANILYLQNRFIEAKEYLSRHIDSLSDQESFWNLYANVEYALGNWEDAASLYQEAVNRAPEVAIFHLNAAHAYDRAGLTDKAVDHYAEAARLYFRQEDFTDLPAVFERIRRIAPDNPVVKTVEAKVRFQEGDIAEAAELFDSLIESGDAESEIYFLKGLLQVQNGDHEKALELYSKAIEMQPDFYLYWLKRAESEYALGEDSVHSLRKAQELEPDDGWIHNLSGLIALENGDLQVAAAELEAAERLLPEQDEVRINRSEVLYRSEGIEKALQSIPAESGTLCNQRGNLWAREGRLDEAIDEYRKAVQLVPEDPVVRENLAAALWDAGLISEADEHLAAVLETHPSVRAYELIGQVAFEKGQYERAAAAWKSALKEEPESERLRLLLARGLLYFGELQESRKMAEELLNSGVSEEAAAIIRKTKELTEDHYQCAECGREWWVPKDLPEQKQVRLVGEPPDEMPAGKCPSCGRVYCIACAKTHMEGNRFICPHCKERLKLMDKGLKYLALEYVSDEVQN